MPQRTWEGQAPAPTLARHPASAYLGAGGRLPLELMCWLLKSLCCLTPPSEIGEGPSERPYGVPRPVTFEGQLTRRSYRVLAAQC